MTKTFPVGYRAKVLRESWTNFSVVRHGAFDGVLVTSKNSGTHWLKYMLAVAIAEMHGIPYPEYFSEDAVRPYIGSPKDAVVYPELPRLAFCHTIPHRSAAWGWAHSLMRLPRYVLTVRHPMAILASHYVKWEHELDVDWLTYLEGDPSGVKYRCDLYWLARFWNRWGDIHARHETSILRVHYEQIVKDPRAILVAVSQHWGIALTERAIDAALAAGTKQAMAQKIDPEGEPNVLQYRDTPLTELFQGPAMEVYSHHVKTLFRRDLGYDLLSFPS